MLPKGSIKFVRKRAMKREVDLFKKYKNEYWKKKTSRKRKSEILDLIEEVNGMNRKSIIRKLKNLRFKDSVAKKSIPVKLGRPRIYDDNVVLALQKVWEVSDKVCGELLHPMIPEYILQCKKYDEWKFSEKIEVKLKMISLSTIKRKVSEFYRKDKDSFRKGVSTTKSSSIKTLIPIKTDSWFKAEIGEGQLDTVVHCGDSLSGEMAYTLNFTDFKTYWIGLRAQLGKGEKRTVESLKYIKENQLPFPMLSIHPDTGSEFINWHMKKVCDSLKIEMTRSRPNHKNDNMCVEERNGHVVRKKIGYFRIDSKEAIIVLNEYYDKLCLLLNHFVAVRRTKEKVRIGSKYQRKFEDPKTPYQIIMESDNISDEVKKEVNKVHDSLNIFELKEDMKKLLVKIKKIQKKKSKLF